MELNHHKRFEYCKTRPLYRRGKKLTAVKVYTIANESKYLLVFGVPKINLCAEVKKEFQKYGPIKLICNVTEEIIKQDPELIEIFTDCYKIQFEKLEHARKAKKFIDAKNFYGGILHVSYAPEYETVDDLQQKLQQRVAEVRYRMSVNERDMKRSGDEPDVEDNVKRAKTFEE